MIFFFFVVGGFDCVVFGILLGEGDTVGTGGGACGTGLIDWIGSVDSCVWEGFLDREIAFVGTVGGVGEVIRGTIGVVVGAVALVVVVVVAFLANAFVTALLKVSRNIFASFITYV